MSVSSISPVVTGNQASVKTSSTAKAESPKADSTNLPQSTSSVVNISNAAKAMLTESTETAAQTAQEARSGDHQAQRQLAKEQAAKPRSI